MCVCVCVCVCDVSLALIPAGECTHGQIEQMLKITIELFFPTSISSHPSPSHPSPHPLFPSQLVWVSRAAGFLSGHCQGPRLEEVFGEPPLDQVPLDYDLFYTTPEQGEGHSVLDTSPIPRLHFPASFHTFILFYVENVGE